ncbi:MAG: GNAT family N-acetyltransferase [Parasphingorhabdus sp.]|uniref:GNAT family N-acetyltransferase n=1 Tax=Parasphingorhabdus sp. TaxID=2709688 RepID=UPI00300223B5
MIETERLLLRPHIIDDFPAFKAMLQDPVVMRYFEGEPSTDNEIWLKFLEHFGRWELLDYGLFSIIEKETGLWVGNAGFGDFRRGLGTDFDPFHEAAWVMSQAGQNKGYAFEAMSAAHIWLEKQFFPEKTVCIINPENAPSIRLAGKLGYQKSGMGIYKDNEVVMFQRPGR